MESHSYPFWAPTSCLRPSALRASEDTSFPDFILFPVPEICLEPQSSPASLTCYDISGVLETFC